MSKLMAAPRDASIARSGQGGGKYHIIATRGDVYGLAACGVQCLYLDCEEPATGLLINERCNRPGCREGFARMNAVKLIRPVADLLAELALYTTNTKQRKALLEAAEDVRELVDADYDYNAKLVKAMTGTARHKSALRKASERRRVAIARVAGES